MTRRRALICAAGGAALGALFTITPLTICVVALGAIVVPALLADLPGRQRRLATAIVGVAIVARLVAIGGVFARNVPLHDDQFVGAPDGDEAYTMSRALRTRGVLREAPGLTKYDYVVAFDEYGRNSFVTALTGLQIVFGPTPYAMRLLNGLVFLIGVLLLFRMCLRAFGWLPAATGLVAVLFWPTLFAWSISLLKEPLYFLLTAVILTGTIRLLRPRRWTAAAAAAIACAAAGAAVRNLRPGAVPLAVAGIAAALVLFVLSRSMRLFALATASVVLVAVLTMTTPRAQTLVLRQLETAAKTHSGHVFTVGHAYKLLDPGFYFNPTTPAASSLQLSGMEAGRYLVRAAASFFVVPTPWQLRSARELAYLPEQVAWYVLVALLPIGIAAGFMRDRLVTCVLLAYPLPTAAALALTNGNVGTLLRLRGLVLPSLVWLGALGFCAALGTAGEPRQRRFVDDDGRLFGRINLFDAALAAFALVLLPLAYGTYLLFRTPATRIESVTRVPITREERRVAGGSTLTAKLKVVGVNLRPMLRAALDDAPTLGFVFENPRSADVLVGPVPPGRHDLILYDGVQEVARLPKSVEIGAPVARRMNAIGIIVHMDRATADGLAPGASFPLRPQDRIVALGPTRQDEGGLWQRRAEVQIQCDADPDEEACAVGGVLLRGTPLPTIRIAGPGDAPLSFAVTETLPSAPPVTTAITVRFASAVEVLRAVRIGDRDDSLDDRAATVTAVVGSRAAGDLDVTMRLGVDQTPDGWTYRGRPLKTGARLQFTTDRYMLEGTVLNEPAPEASRGNDARR